MIVVDTGSEPIIFSNSVDDGVVPFIRRDYPDAVIYSGEPSAYGQAMAHVNATSVVYHDEASLDAEGNPITVQIGEHVPVGNSVAVAGGAMELLDAGGSVIGSIPLTVVA